MHPPHVLPGPCQCINRFCNPSNRSTSVGGAWAGDKANVGCSHKTSPPFLSASFPGRQTSAYYNRNVPNLQRPASSLALSCLCGLPLPHFSSTTTPCPLSCPLHFHPTSLHFCLEHQGSLQQPQVSSNCSDVTSGVRTSPSCWIPPSPDWSLGTVCPLNQSV